MSSSRVAVDEKRIDTLLTRGVVAVYPTPQAFRQKLTSGVRLRVYLGIDPTIDSLHLGHVAVLRKLKAFQDLGHEVILLIGDFTGRIGDPTDKLSIRRRLGSEEVMRNARPYRKQASAILRFSGSNPAKIRYNSAWWEKLSFEKILDIAGALTVSELLKRDMFEKRLRAGKPIFLNEFLYPLMHGYDSVALDADVEVGGSDQTFNMLVGRHLSRTLRGKEKFVVAAKLLEDVHGKKMGKSEGNAVSLESTPDEMLGVIMSWNDDLIVPGRELFTDDPSPTLRPSENPFQAKLRLAEEIVGMLYGVAQAKKAREIFIQTFRERKPPEEIPETVVTAGTRLIDAVLTAKLVSSKGAFSRLIKEGAVSDVDTDTKISNRDEVVVVSRRIKIGKHRFLKIVVRR